VIEVLLKAVLPILLTEAGIIKESLRLDSLNALSSILVTEAGIVKVPLRPVAL
jgi:hypothetical protein